MADTICKRGVIYVAYGNPAHQAARESMKKLKLPVAVVSEVSPWDIHIPFKNPGRGARWAKLNVDTLSPFEQTLYLDADTKVLGDVSVGFDILDDGWELVIVPSANQPGVGSGWLWHCKDKDSVLELYWTFALALQGGMFYFEKSERIHEFFEIWRSEWGGDQDQAALLRALWRYPLRVWLLGSPFNSSGGEIVDHIFGAARAR